MSAEEELAKINNNQHRMIAQSDFDALQAIWKPEPPPECALQAAANERVWELFKLMVIPVSDRTYAEYTTFIKEEGDENEDLPPLTFRAEESSEFWVSQEAVDRAQGLREQVRKQADAVVQTQDRWFEMLVGLMEQELNRNEETMQSAELQPPLAETAEKENLQESKQTKEIAEALKNEFIKMQGQIPKVSRDFYKTLDTVRDEEGFVISNDDQDVQMSQEEEAMNEMEETDTLPEEPHTHLYSM